MAWELVRARPYGFALIATNDSDKCRQLLINSAPLDVFALQVLHAAHCDARPRLAPSPDLDGLHAELGFNCSCHWRTNSAYPPSLSVKRKTGR